jgi:hypothetical protein
MIERIVWIDQCDAAPRIPSPWCIVETFALSVVNLSTCRHCVTSCGRTPRSFHRRPCSREDTQMESVWSSAGVTGTPQPLFVTCLPPALSAEKGTVAPCP